MSSGKDGGGPRVPPESYYSVFEFMSSSDGLALKGAELAVFALVYSYSQGRGGCYYGSAAMTAHRTNISERHAVQVVHALEERGLIRNVGEHRFNGRITNMYVANLARVRAAIANCLAAGEDPGKAPEASSDVHVATPEPSSEVPLNSEQRSPDTTSANKKTSNKGYESGEGGEGKSCEETPTIKQAASDSFEEAFKDVLRAYPYTNDAEVARRLYAALYAKGVRACHISNALEEWAKTHPTRTGRRQYYPELGSFLDPNNPEGYEAIAKHHAKEANRQARINARNATAPFSAAEMYERYTLDGCDAKATELFQTHLSEDDGTRGRAWDVWYQYMMLRRDTQARLHWLELRKRGEV